MSHFTYQNGVLCAENVPLPEIAAAVGTPVYVYSANRLRRNFRTLQEAMPSLTLHYAVKANANQAVLSLLAKLGAGADIVSGGELTRALAAGIPARKIVFSGVGKTDAEITQALEAGLHQINVESREELHQISRIASARGVVAPVALRVNPDVAAATHDKIATGRKGDKFGIDHELLAEAAALTRTLPALNLVGLAVHIGSQLFDIDIYRKAFTVVAGYVRELRAAGFAMPRLDLGGGMGVPYQDESPFDAAGYAAMVAETLGPLQCALSIEPGRFIVADAGILLTRITHVKQGLSEQFVVLDGAMNDLVRPAMYDAWHTLTPVTAPQPNAVRQSVHVVGPICESSDFFAKARDLPPVGAGDLMAIETAGAYGSSMASTYNARPLVAEVLVEDTRYAVIRPAVDVATQMSWERVPVWV